MPELSPARRVGTIVKTTDATQTTLAQFQTKPNCSYWVECKVISTENVDFDEVGGYWRRAVFKNDGGTLALVGSVRTVVPDDESTGSWDVTLDANSDDIRVRVTGAAATAITWRAVVDIWENDGVTP